jgi:serine/tyrosine/threonine adenylyltransferase
MLLTMPRAAAHLENTAGWRLEHSYAQLPDCFFEPVEPTAVREPKLVILNEALAAEMGLDAEALQQQVEVFSGNALPPGASPISQAYAGHQYGHFTMLGDGRAILLGEHRTPTGKLVDIQLKGSGPTPYSRRGDGRAALGPMLREYLISEAMHALGIPTTRSLAIVSTGEPVYRQSGAQPGAILTRIATSHLRIGTFEYAATQNEAPTLLRYAIARHAPQLREAPQPTLAFLNEVIERQASLLAQWMSIGFIHGVMNTDNTTISGETIDYGPCAYMDTFDPQTVFSSIDRHGRYAYSHQPPIVQWNLARLAEALLPQLHKDEKTAIDLANEAIEAFQPRYQHHWLQRLRAKLGLFHAEEEDAQLIDTLLNWMHSEKADFTNTFADLSRVTDAAWQQRWQARLARQPQSPAEATAHRQRSNPQVIPRNHRVEEVLTAAEHGDLRPFHQLLAILQSPYHLPASHHDYRQPSVPDTSYRTFCGT